MAGAYAALLSLYSTIEKLPQRSLISLTEPVKETTSFLLQLFEEYHDSELNRAEFMDLEIRTKDLALGVGYALDAFAMEQMLINSESGDDNMSAQLSSEVLKEFEHIKEEALKIMIHIKPIEAQLPSSVSSPTGPSRGSQAAENRLNITMVGFDHHMIKVMEQIKSHESTLQILSVVGTGGIGKTTLTQNVYDSQLVKNYFEIRLWSTISQSYNVRDVLAKFLNDLKIVPGGNMSDDELGEILYKTLYSRRFIIVLDDIWDVELWNAIRRYLPKNGNRSRVIITTRLLMVASRIGSCDPCKLEYLDEDESWNLLNRKVFVVNDGCPSKLKDVGRRIARGCKGLPLALVVIAGQLANSDMSEESWENVARDINSILHSEVDNPSLAILSLSYNNLPMYLKPCFLHMGFSSADLDIRVSDKIRQWVADDLIKPISGKILEDTAMDYINDLHERNLILVSKRGSSGKIKCIRIHDLLRELCHRKAHEDAFVWKDVIHTLSQRYLHMDFSTFSWKNRWSPADEKLLMYRSRYIEFSASEAMDISTFSTHAASVSILHNLQTLIVKETPGNEPVSLPPDIWEMPLLRQLDIKQVVLPDPLTAAHVIGEERCVLENLQTLRNVHCLKLSEEVVRRIPNVKKLGITYTNVSGSNMDWPSYHLNNLAQLCKLESLSLSVCETISTADISLPRSLKKLILDGCNLLWEDMTMVGSLPNLEVLRLQNDAFCGREWRPVEGEFLRLKALHLRNMSLQLWNADSGHFPRLERLTFCNVWRLKEIPSSIGEIATLEFISTDLCRSSLELSVSQLIEEQKIGGNDDIQGHETRKGPIRSVFSSLYKMLLCSSDEAYDIIDPSDMVAKFEDDLCELQDFLSYTTREKQRIDERLKELAKHIRNVIYESADAVYNVALQPDNGESLSYSFRRLLFVVKEVDYLSVRVQRILLPFSYKENEKLAWYREPSTDLFDWKTDDEAFSSRMACMINKYKNQMDPDRLIKELDVAKPEPVCNSESRLIHRDFALLTAVDGISVENEMKLEQFSTVHFGIICDYCETEVMEPIVGVRYRCKDCVDDDGGFDLCRDCYSTRHTLYLINQKHTPDHEFDILTSMALSDGTSQSVYRVCWD